MTKFPASYHEACRRLVAFGASRPNDETRAFIAKSLRQCRNRFGYAEARKIRKGLLFISGHFPRKQELMKFQQRRLKLAVRNFIGYGLGRLAVDHTKFDIVRTVCPDRGPEVQVQGEFDLYRATLHVALRDHRLKSETHHAISLTNKEVFHLSQFSEQLGLDLAKK